jgi:hypothetical protein
LWSTASEINGRKVGLGVSTLFDRLDERGSHLLQPVYLAALTMFMVGNTALAFSKTIKVMIGMRALQTAG